MATKTISFTLDTASIGRAIKELEQYRKDLQAACQELARRLTEEGVVVAKMYVAAYPAVDTGELMNSIDGYYSPNLHAGFVRANAWYAVFVEYGTGVRGSDNPHPAPVGWEYDVNHHGDDGWVYKSERDGKFHWTKGMPSRPFMYDTFRELERKAETVAREVFSKL